MSWQGRLSRSLPLPLGWRASSGPCTDLLLTRAGRLTLSLSPPDSAKLFPRRWRLPGQLGAGPCSLDPAAARGTDALQTVICALSPRRHASGRGCARCVPALPFVVRLPRRPGVPGDSKGKCCYLFPENEILIDFISSFSHSLPSCLERALRRAAGAMESTSQPARPQAPAWSGSRQTRWVCLLGGKSRSCPWAGEPVTEAKG